MFHLIPFELSLWHWLMLGGCALLVGSSKTCMPGLSILVIPIMASILPAKVSVGVLLPMLIFADFFAIFYYHRYAQWKHILCIFPWTLAGLVLGYVLMSRIDSTQLKPVIGVVILAMLVLWVWQNHRKEPGHNSMIRLHWAFIALLGFSGGVTTILANAAGPIITIYLLSLALSKERFIGTGAWYIFIINLVKVPLNINLGLITVSTLALDFILLPLILIGGWIGIYILRKIHQNMFVLIVQILVALSAIKLFISS